MIHPNDIARAKTSILNGGVILCPTDTIWGLSADARDNRALVRVFDIKNRPENKSMIVLVSDETMLANYVNEIPKLAIDLLHKASRPTSIIYPSGKNLAPLAIAANGSVAIRIIKEEFCNRLITELGFPIISTSANLSGEASAPKFEDVSAIIKDRVDYIVEYKQNDKNEASASSIFSIKGDEIEQLR
jgi:L-threonylcarbamoyladenylate synthase